MQRNFVNYPQAQFFHFRKIYCKFEQLKKQNNSMKAGALITILTKHSITGAGEKKGDNTHNTFKKILQNYFLYKSQYA